MRYLLILALILAALLAAACGSAPAPAGAPAPFPAELQRDAAAMQEAGVKTEVAGDVLLQARKVIYNGTLSLVVTNTEAAAQQVEALAESLGGYVANMNAYRGFQDAMFFTITLRIPSEQFETARAALRDLAVRVENDNINTDDVTDQYYDLDARLRTLRATETELLALLSETRARNGSVEDIMAIYRELTSIQGQIESLQGQLSRLDTLVAFSTLTVNLQQDALSQPITTAWRPLETVRNSTQTLVNVLQGLVNVVIFLVIVALPTLLVLAIPTVAVLLVLRFAIRRLRQRRASS